MRAEEIMSRDVVTVDVEDSLRIAVEYMLEEGVGSVIVLSAGAPAGMVTETDALRAGYRTGRPFGDIPVEDVMTRPVKTIEADTIISRVAARMRDHGVKKLPVMDGIELVGVITLTDLLHHFAEDAPAADDVFLTGGGGDGEHFSDPIGDG